MRAPVILLWLGAAAAALTASANASAHYYGIVINSSVPFNDADNGMMVNIRTDDLTNNGNCGIFVNHEMWYGVVPGATYWVEVGVKSGETDTSGLCVYDEIFWADNVNGEGYHEHYNSVSWSIGTWYQAVIATGFSCSWNITFGGVFLGTSMYNCPGTGRYLAGGIEATDGLGWGRAKGWMWNWQRLDHNGNWQTGWDGAGLLQDSPPFIQWTDGGIESEEVHNDPW